MQETQVLFLDQEDPLEKEMATHSSIVAWRTPWTEEPGGLQSIGLQESDTTEWLNHHQAVPSAELISLDFSLPNLGPGILPVLLSLQNLQIGGVGVGWVVFFFNFLISATFLEFFSLCSSFSRAQLFVTPWTAAHHAPLSMRFSRQGYWSELPFPSPGDLPNPGIKPRSSALQADSLPTELQGKPHI